MTTDVIGLETDFVRTITITSRTINLLSCQDVMEDDFLATIFCFVLQDMFDRKFKKYIILSLIFVPLDSYNSGLSYDLHCLFSDHINRVSIKVYSIPTIEKKCGKNMKVECQIKKGPTWKYLHLQDKSFIHIGIKTKWLKYIIFINESNDFLNLSQVIHMLNDLS